MKGFSTLAFTMFLSALCASQALADGDQASLESKKVRKCCGHNIVEHYSSAYNAGSAAESLNEKYGSDPNIAEHNVWIYRKPSNGRRVKAEYRHIDNAPSCDNYILEDISVKEGTREHV